MSSDTRARTPQFLHYFFLLVLLIGVTYTIISGPAKLLELKRDPIFVHVLIFAISTIGFTIPCALNLMLHAFGITVFKVQPIKKCEWIKLLKCIPEISFNGCISHAIMYATYMAVSEKQWDVSEAPGLFTIAWQIVFFVSSEEVLFYYAHRFFHENKRAYAMIHKKHHEWKSPVALVAIYCHPVEHVLCNMIPMITSLVLADMHVYLITLLFLVGLSHTCGVHSGYFWDDDGMHDYHHEAFNYNYGVSGILDWIHGTYCNPHVSAKYAVKSS